MADTTALNYLVLLKQCQILQALYGRVVVPTAVLGEMLAGGAPKEVRDWASRPPDWVDVIQATELDATLPGRLGAGEREAISLAIEMTMRALAKLTGE